MPVASRQPTGIYDCYVSWGDCGDSPRGRPTGYEIPPEGLTTSEDGHFPAQQIILIASPQSLKKRVDSLFKVIIPVHWDISFGSSSLCSRWYSSPMASLVLADCSQLTSDS
uniref:(California timema) hypothetical protein n=1 Tax=Timema californicum TaxID=61474 RepID=A0A7R9JKM4_TIMCA|nr:unnamed protein product [Timema californicum]